MKTLREQKLGKKILRIVDKGGETLGVVIANGKVSAPIPGANEDEIWEQLVEEAGRHDPNFFGYDGAIVRFKSIFPNGFEGSDYLSKERNYKTIAARKLSEACSIEQALSGDFDPFDLATSTTNMLHMTESLRLRDVLKSRLGTKFVEGGARFSEGDLAAGLAQMSNAANPFARASSPMMTYFPFLWRPDNHMFLKPNVTIDFAERVGHPFAHLYQAEARGEVYQSLLDLVSSMREQIASLGPHDNIDLQSFIWVVGAYTDDDRP